LTSGNVTEIYIDTQDHNLVDQTTWLDQLDDSTNPTNKGVLILRSTSSSGSTVNIFNITGVTSASGYRIISVQEVSGTSPTNNEILSLNFSRTGDVGSQGVQGTQGVQGLQGIQGRQGIQGVQGLQGVQGRQGIQGVQGTSGTNGTNGTNGSQGIQGVQGVAGPSTVINAENDTSSTTLYPTMVGNSGTNQTIKVTTTSGYLSFNASTGVLSTTAAKARYADLAEKYIADAEYDVGTVLILGGDKEVTMSTSEMSTSIVGVVSIKPAYLMNSNLTAKHTAIVALQGRVPVKVLGTVRKGDMLVSAPNGFAKTSVNPVVGSVIGKALEDFIAESEQQTSLIEVVVGKH
jgi:hypothetical protein